MLMITALSGTISGECLFYKENGGYQNEDIWKKQQFTGKRKENIKRNNKKIKQIHAKTIPFKHVVIDRIWFDDYYCMNRMKQDIDDFFMTSNSTSTHLQNH